MCGIIKKFCLKNYLRVKKYLFTRMEEFIYTYKNISLRVNNLVLLL